MPTVFLTGANRGLGLEFARQYAADGWHVIATCRDPSRAEALKHLEGRVDIHPLDVTDLSAVERLAATISDATLDLLIANAGMMGSRTMTPDRIDGELWSEVFRVNTMAPLAVAGALRGQVARSGEGKMIAISSRLGSIGSNSDGGLYVYRSSKAALNAAWRSFALDNPVVIAAVLHPGWVRTDMGGAGATLTPTESVAGMRRVITGLTRQDSGGFFNHDGAPIPW